MNITILGSGSFASAMAMHLAALDHNVLLWSIDADQVEAINSSGHNTFVFQDIKLSDKIKATLSLEQAIDFSEWYIMAIPTQFEREVLEQITRITEAPGHMLNLAKGIEISTGNLLHTVHAELCPNFTYSALSGPSHAEEVALSYPTCVAIASKTPGEAELWQKIINGNHFRIYTSDDVIGLEVGGATKNIYAVAAGIARAMDLGDNAVAALACRGLAEIMRLGHKMGASPLTLSGLAGVGDLMVTCYSMHSRNFRLGLAIGQGKSFDQAVAELGQVAEGAYTVRAVIENSKKFDVELPLAESVYRVIYEGESPQDLLAELMAREPKREMRF